MTLYGDMDAQARRLALTHLNGVPASGSRLVLVSGRYVGEGHDDTRLDTPFLALTVSLRRMFERLLKGYRATGHAAGEAGDSLFDAFSRHAFSQAGFNPLEDRRGA